MVSLAVPGCVLYLLAALGYVRLARRRESVFLLAIAASWILLAEAMAVVAASRNWQISWWEWHILMLVAFAAIAFVVRRLPDSEPFGDLYLDEVAGGTREVSVVFADLAGFTSYSERHPPSSVQAMLNTYFEAVLPVFRDEDGHVDSFVGDSVMVTFNVAADQPDHAERASRSALAFQRAAAVVAGRHPGWPRFRVGVNTGVAAVGIVGDGARRDYTVLGDMVNVASRLEALAPVGAVAIGEPTRQALTGVNVRSLGTVQVKGRTEPVEVWQLVEVPERR